MTVTINGTTGVTTPGLTDTGNLSVSGTSSLNSQPLLTTAPSMIQLNAANGYGSTNTYIRRFSNTTVSQGTDITYADSASLGASFTINTSGVYSITYFDNFNAANTWLGVTNGASGTTALNAVATAAQVLALNIAISGGYPCTASWTGYLSSGSVIRPHTSGTASGGAGSQYQQFTISRIA